MVFSYYHGNKEKILGSRVIRGIPFYLWVILNNSRQIWRVMANMVGKVRLTIFVLYCFGLIIINEVISFIE